MKSDKVKTFIELAGAVGDVESARVRELAAQLLLSETLEYVIKGLGVTPMIDGHPISKPDHVQYAASAAPMNRLEMIDGLCDVAYTMYWNAEVYQVKLEEAFDRVCNNNLEKFVLLTSWTNGEGPLPREQWDLGQGITWPDVVVEVTVKKVGGAFYAVGKDQSGKVRKPSKYKSVELSDLC